MLEKAGAVDKEIEITPEMIEAGLLEFFGGDTEFEPSEDIVARIYRAMLAAQKQSGALDSRTGLFPAPWFSRRCFYPERDYSAGSNDQPDIPSPHRAS